MVFVPERAVMLGRRFVEALGYAVELHADQRRKGSEVPYVAHLLAVAALVLDYGGDEDQAIAALLHDAVEDQGGRETLDTIAERFGDRVARIVAGCTDAWVVPKPPWRERKERYLAAIAHEPGDVLLVSMADKLHNARAILRDYREVGEELWKRFAGGREGTLWYYRELVRAFSLHGKSPVLEELDATVAKIERAAKRSPSPERP